MLFDTKYTCFKNVAKPKLKKTAEDTNWNLYKIRVLYGRQAINFFFECQLLRWHSKLETKWCFSEPIRRKKFEILLCSCRQHGLRRRWRDGRYSPTAAGRIVAWISEEWSASGRWARSPGCVHFATWALRRPSCGIAAAGSDFCTASPCDLERKRDQRRQWYLQK